MHMALTTTYSPTEPTRAEVDDMKTALVLEFGSATCGFCRAAQPAIASALSGHGGVRHIKVADGSGRPLGRSFGVKLWPTLVFMKEGKEVARLVRPREAEPIRQALEKIDANH
jgi:thioredoxin 1